MKIVKFKIEGEIYDQELPDDIAEIHMQDGSLNDLIMQNPDRLKGYIESVDLSLKNSSNKIADNIIHVGVGENGKLQIK